MQNQASGVYIQEWVVSLSFFGLESRAEAKGKQAYGERNTKELLSFTSGPFMC